MDKDRDEFLDDLIKYYDDDESDTSDELAEENMGDTIIISKDTPAPQEETFGDTVMVDVKPKQKDTIEEATVTEETTAVSLPQQTVEEPVEEVFGNLGLDGKPIDSNAEQYDSSQQTGQPGQRRYTDIEPVVFNREPEEDAPVKNTGIWYALKPLWVTIIASLCLSLFAWAWIKEYTDVYIFNFKCNLEVICERLGIEYDPFAGEVSINTNNPYPSVLANENTIYISKAEAGENYTEHNNERKKAPSKYSSISERKKLIPFAEADSSEFAAYDSGVVCAKSNYICHMNEDGEIVWEYTTSVSNPLLSAAGDYIAIASKEGTQITLYKSGELLFSTDAPNKIKTCEVSLDGDIVLVTEKPAYKGAVVVLNKKGEEVFSWVSGSNYITSASNLQGRNIAVVLADASSRITSYVMLFDIFSPEPLSAVELKETLLYDSSYLGKSVYVAGDNSIGCVNLDGNVVYDMRFDNVYVTRSKTDRRGNRLITYTQDYIPAMNVYDKNGKLVYSGNIESTPDCVDIFETAILYNNGRNVICGDIDDENRTSYTAPMSVKDLVLLTDDTYVIVYEDTIEFIGI